MTANVPTVERKRDGYDLAWPDGIRIEVRRIRRASDDLRCELLIADTAAGDALIHFGRINLLASETVSRLSRHLSERVNHVDWMSSLTQLVFLVAQKERLGEPVIDMGAMAEPADLGYLVQNWLLPGLPTTLFGLGGTGKTYLGLLLLMAASHGLPFLSYHTARPLQAMMIDYENNEHLTRRRLGRIARGMNLPVPPILYRRLELPLPDYEEALARNIDRHGIDLIMVDSFGLATGAGQNKDEAILPVYTTLRRLNVSSLLIDHESKESATGKANEFAIGSVYKHNSSRITYNVKAAKEAQEKGRLYLRLSNQKANEDVREHPYGVELIFTPDTVSARRIQVKDLPSDLVEGLPLRERILIELGQHTVMSTKELADLLGESADNVRKRLNELTKDNKIARLKEGGKGAGDDSSWGLRSGYE